jgi:transposase
MAKGTDLRLRSAIGIDPEAKGIRCCLVGTGGEKPRTKAFLVTHQGVKGFIRWVKKAGKVIIAIEGSNGQSRPIERALRAEGLVFYSFKPSDVAKFRKAVLGQNKNNDKDAESVARYAMALEAQGKLNGYKRVWFPDRELQGLTRSDRQKTAQLTAEVNRLWKLLRTASPDLYLALRGANPEIEINGNMLQNQGILALLAEKPDVFEWKTLSRTGFLQSMGGRLSNGRQKLIMELQKVAKTFRPVPPSLSLMIENSATQILLLKKQLKRILATLEQMTQENKAVNILRGYKGIATRTASTLIAEIVNIRRFVSNDALACYAGLGMREHSTGERNNMVHSSFFNHRLKHTLMTAGRNFVLHNPDSHLAGYYRNLVKGGMSAIESRKRVARALVRVIFRALHAIGEDEETSATRRHDERGRKRESDMASGQVRSDKDHESDISLSPLNNHDTPCRHGVKTGPAQVESRGSARNPRKDARRA